MSAQRQVNVEISYGIGGSVFARFSRHEIAGLSVVELVRRVLGQPQEPGSATRTARVLAEALRTERLIDAELKRAGANAADGEPIALDQIVLREEDGEEQRKAPVVGQETDSVEIRLSEPYRGGTRRGDGR